MKIGRWTLTALLPVLLFTAAGCATTTSSSTFFFEPSIQRSDVRIRRVAIVPNRLPLNLADPESWRSYNWETAAEEFQKRGFEVVDYATSVSTFERSGLPLEDTPNSRDKFADLARELNVDAIIVPYYGTLFESAQIILMSEMHWIGVITFQIYLTSANDFFARLDLSGDTRYVFNYGTFLLTAAAMTNPSTEQKWDPETMQFVEKKDTAAESLKAGLMLTGLTMLIIDITYGIMGAKYMWKKSFHQAIRKGLEPFFAAYPAAR